VGKVDLFFRSVRQRRVSLAATSGGICAVILWGLWCFIWNPHKNPAPPAVDFQALGTTKNEISGCRVSVCDPESNRRPLYSIGFRKLRVDKGRIGVFNTALFKVITIEGLKVQLFTYGQDPQVAQWRWPGATVGAATSSQATPDALRARVVGIQQQILDNLLGELRRTSLGCSLQLDVSNTAEVVVKDLDYALVQDGSPQLRIRCHRAMVGKSSSIVELRDGVVITASDGGRLQSGYVQWDVEKGHFAAPGGYILHRGGKPVIGRGFCCDQQLCAAPTHLAGPLKGEGNG
jgi:hypothetical protein